MRRDVLQSRTIQTVVGIALGCLVAAGIHIAASPRVIDQTPSIAPKTVVVAVEAAPTIDGAVDSETATPAATPAPAPVEQRQLVQKARSTPGLPAPSPSPPPLPPRPTPAPPSTAEPTAAPTPTASPTSTPTDKPPKDHGPNKTPKPPGA